MMLNIGDLKNIMKRFIISLLLAAVPVMVSAQVQQVIDKAAQRLEIVTVETEQGSIASTQLEVFQMKDDGSYWLSVGNLGVGTDLLQIQFDPVFELFIPLGNTLEEALEKLKDLQSLYKKPRLFTTVVDGCLAAMYPNGDMEPVTVTSRRFVATKLLSFSVQRDDLVRATYISKMDFGSLVLSLKMYKKLHPKEK